VNSAKRRRLSRSALAYLRSIKFPEVPIRFDIVEVIVINDVINEIRHLPNTFSLSRLTVLDEAVTEKNLSTDDIDGADGTEVIGIQ